MKETICTAFAVIGGALTLAFGGWDGMLITLVIFLAADYLTGLIVAGLFHASPNSETGALESRAGWKGLVRKCATILCVLIAHRLDLALGVAFIRDAVIVGFITNELISLVENFGLMGVPLPKVFYKVIDILEEKSEAVLPDGEDK